MFMQGVLPPRCMQVRLDQMSLAAVCHCRYGLIVLIVEVIGVSSMLPYGLMLVCYTAVTTSR